VNDPLSHILFDDDVPDEHRNDPEFAKAQADVDAIKRGLRQLAATTPPSHKPAQNSRWNGGVILAVAACTLLAVAIGGVFVSQGIGNQADTAAQGGSSAEKPGAPAPAEGDAGSGDGNSGSEGQDLTEEGVLACATQVLDGVIEDILPGPQTTDVLVDVTHSYKPSSRSAERMAPITVTLDQPTSPDIRVGAKALLIISRFPNEPPLLFAGKDRTDALERFSDALRSTDLPPCPGPG
jgi:hypothetical protein